MINEAEPAGAAPKPARTPVVLAILAAAVSGALLAASYSLHPIWWAAWLAPAPVLAAAVTAPAGWGRNLGGLAGLIAGVTTFSYYVEVTGLAGAGVILLLRAAMWAGCVNFAGRLARRAPAYIAVFALPVAGAAIETLVLWVSPHGTAGSLAYSQMDWLAVIQVAALGGVPIIVFLVLLGGSALGLAGARLLGAPVATGGLAVAVVLAGGIITGALVWGGVRLLSAPTGRGLDVALAATDQLPGAQRAWAPVWRVYGPVVRDAAHPGAVVVLPEALARLSPGEAAAAAQEVANLARTRQALIVVGIEVDGGPGDDTNRALVARPDGGVAWYDKQHPVPGLEADIRPGHALLPLRVFGAHEGVAICKDMHFAQLGRAYGAASTQLMLVPANDFVRDAWLSDRLTVLRGVEAGYAIARAARHGFSSISDRYGRILAQAASPADGMAVVHSWAPLESAAEPTPYARFGDLFGWACVALSLGLSVSLRRARPT